MNGLGGFALRWTLDQQPRTRKRLGASVSEDEEVGVGSTSTSGVRIPGEEDQLGVEQPVHGSGDNNCVHQPIPGQKGDQGQRESLPDDILKLIPAITDLVEAVQVFKDTAKAKGPDTDEYCIKCTNTVGVGDKGSGKSSSCNGLMELNKLLAQIQMSLPFLQDQIESQTTEYLQKYFEIRKKLEELDKAREVIEKLKSLGLENGYMPH